MGTLRSFHLLAQSPPRIFFYFYSFFLMDRHRVVAHHRLEKKCLGPLQDSEFKSSFVQKTEINKKEKDPPPNIQPLEHITTSAG